MHLAETSLIKKYENDIGGEISNIGGNITHDSHWLPYLDNAIKDQLVGDFIIDEKIDKKLDERGISEENIDAWNKALEDLGLLEDRVETLENAPANSIKQTDINAWNQALEDLGLLEDRVETLENAPANSIKQTDINAWNQALEDLGLLEDRVDDIENSPALSINQTDIDVWNMSSYWKENKEN